MIPTQASSQPTERLPISVLTGFLGSGKTTLLRRVLASPGFADTAVIVNEFGSVGLDHLLLEAVDQDVVVLPNGCVCCAVRQDLAETLYRLLRRRTDGSMPAFRRLVLETSGLAEPAPILYTLSADAFLEHTLRLDGVVTTIDSVAGLATLERFQEATMQAACADRLVLTKTDLAPPSPELRQRLAALNPLAAIVEVAATGMDAATGMGAKEPAGMGPTGMGPTGMGPTGMGLAEAGSAERGAAERGAAGMGPAAMEPAELLFGGTPVAPARFTPTRLASTQPVPTRRRLVATAAHTHRISTFVLGFGRSFTRLEFAMALGGLARARGEDLLRVKGLMLFADASDSPAVIQAVQHTLYPPEWLAGWPDEDHRSRLVFIVRDIPIEEITERFAAGEPMLIETPTLRTGAD